MGQFTGWTGGDLAAGDVAWEAWRRLGIDAFDVVSRDEMPSPIEQLRGAMDPAVDAITRAVLDEAPVRLYGEARERVVSEAQRDMARHILWAVVEAVRLELMRPEPEPFSPPAAGAWVRARWLPGRGRPEPKWDGLWHRFTGDIQVPGVQRASRVDNRRNGRTACGIWQPVRWPGMKDAVVSRRPPGVDACRRCLASRGNAS